jgi:hypothetical protein
MIPTRKISETIIEFGTPILQELPNEPSKEEYDAAFHLIVSAWNAITLDKRNKTNKFEKEFLLVLQELPKKLRNILKAMLKKRKKPYSSDQRSVGEYSVIVKNGEIVFRADARVDLEKIDTVATKY